MRNKTIHRDLDQLVTIEYVNPDKKVNGMWNVTGDGWTYDPKLAVKMPESYAYYIVKVLRGLYNNQCIQAIKYIPPVHER